MAKNLQFKTKVSKNGKITISNPAGGYTVVAFREGQRMVRYATAWCSPADKFKRGVGKDVCADKFANGETSIAPLAELDNDYLIDALDSAHLVLANY